LFELKNWRVENKRVIGNCFGNVKFSDGYYITTSCVVSINTVDSGLVVETQSGSNYLLRFGDIDKQSANVSEAELSTLGYSLDVDKCITLWIIREQEEEDRVKAVLQPNNLYLSMAGVFDVLSAWYCDSDGNLRKVEVSHHVSSYGPDSIIIALPELCDFRFFQYSSYIEQYHWSDGLERVYIENKGAEFEFRNGASSLCPQNRLVSVTNGVNSTEGLVSPDLVDGRSVWTE